MSGPSPVTRCAFPRFSICAPIRYEFAEITSNKYYDWFVYHGYMMYGGADDRRGSGRRPSGISRRIQKPNSFTIDQIAIATDGAKS